MWRCTPGDAESANVISAPITSAPSLTRHGTTALPIPEAAPVTRARLEDMRMFKMSYTVFKKRTETDMAGL